MEKPRCKSVGKFSATRCPFFSGRMEDNRKLKTLVFGIVEGANKRGRPCTGCKTGLQEINSLVHDHERSKVRLKVPTFIYRHLQGNPNSSGLQLSK